MTDVLTVGEAMLRLSVRPGDRLESAPAYDVHVAGAEANVAVALAALGRNAAWFSLLPDSSLGRRVERELAALGVDTSTVGWVPDARLGTYFVELSEPPRPIRVVYDRKDSAVSTMSAADLPWDAIDSAPAVMVSGITPALSSGCREAIEALSDRVREGPGMWIVDVNHRAQLWSGAEARSCLERVAAGADLVVCTREDGRDVFGLDGPTSEVAASLTDRLGARRVVVTDGEAGAHWREGPDTGHVPSVPATTIDRLGAGDAFTAGVIDGMLAGDLELGVRQGVVMGALALGMRGDHLRTTRPEVEALMGGTGRRIDR